MTKKRHGGKTSHLERISKEETQPHSGNTLKKELIAKRKLSGKLKYTKGQASCSGAEESFTWKKKLLVGAGVITSTFLRWARQTEGGKP